jgi:beta-phosphoglucomutase-like phosphatase (HAD superfamily)
MPPAKTKPVITRDRYDAVLFDLDGVITDTASLHAACWKQMFDEYLRRRATQRGEPFRPFDIATDYRLYVDGKPRFDGVRDFLRSRDITSLKEPRTTRPRPKRSAGSATARTT